ncbi:sigma 54-interacting transcriptional regulator, partial [Roseomonas sp. DSM 102946]|nr:sigma 54-interacting transcriptional regulator [Roseomonas sp. DSM 102946]
KELFARAVHYNSDRRKRGFVAVNCAAIPEALLESELFGHVKGAFTGAIASRDGRFTMAHQGTLFLDEIGDMPLAIQAKLLRAIQEQCFEPVGSTRTIKVDVRIVAATHRDLRRAVEDGRFREDLFYRLNVFPINVPPLNQRTGDVPLLAQRFLQQHAASMGKRISGFSPAALAAMESYDWPGNVRELQNCVERAVIVARAEIIDLPDLPRYLFETRVPSASAARLPGDLDAELTRLEREMMLEALRQSGG